MAIEITGTKAEFSVGEKVTLGVKYLKRVPQSVVTPYGRSRYAETVVFGSKFSEVSP
jgi:hypothetical protein